MLPDVPPSVCYCGVLSWQRVGTKPAGHCNLARKSGRQGASRRGDCQHQRGRELAAQGKVNVK
jgi:hypothetical protein